MNPAYKDVQHEADHLFHRCESMIDDRAHETAEKLESLSRDVREMIEGNRGPRTIEDSIKRVQQILERLKSAPSPAMSPQDAGSLLHAYEDLRRRVRQLPNF